MRGPVAEIAHPIPLEVISRLLDQGPERFNASCGGARGWRHSHLAPILLFRGLKSLKVQWD